MAKLHLGIPVLPPAYTIRPASSGDSASPFPAFLILQVPGLMWKSELKYLCICQCGQDQNLLLAFCFSPSILQPKRWLSGAGAEHGQRLNQEEEKLTALAALSSFLFLPSSIGTVLNYTKIACKALINLTCSNAAFPH